MDYQIGLRLRILAFEDKDVVFDDLRFPRGFKAEGVIFDDFIRFKDDFRSNPGGGHNVGNLVLTVVNIGNRAGVSSDRNGEKRQQGSMRFHHCAPSLVVDSSTGGWAT